MTASWEPDELRRRSTSCCSVRRTVAGRSSPEAEHAPLRIDESAAQMMRRQNAAISTGARFGRRARSRSAWRGSWVSTRIDGSSLAFVDAAWAKPAAGACRRGGQRGSRACRSRSQTTM
ncbi:MAG: hypothetical protein ACLTMP_10660 [Eggerthella lenta]